MKLRNVFFSLVACVAASSALHASNITVLVTVDWVLTSSSSIAPCSMTDATGSGTNATESVVSTTPTNADASTRGVSSTTPISANPLNCVGGRSATYVWTGPGFGTAHVIASASATVQRVANQPGTGYARTRAKFTAWGDGALMGSVLGVSRSDMAFPASASAPVSIDVTKPNIEHFEYETATRAWTDLALQPGGSARLGGSSEVGATVTLY